MLPEDIIKYLESCAYQNDSIEAKLLLNKYIGKQFKCEVGCSGNLPCPDMAVICRNGQFCCKAHSDSYDLHHGVAHSYYLLDQLTVAI
jgi:hypothetical protein